MKAFFDRICKLLLRNMYVHVSFPHLAKGKTCTRRERKRQSNFSLRPQFDEIQVGINDLSLSDYVEAVSGVSDNFS